MKNVVLEIPPKKEKNQLINQEEEKVAKTAVAKARNTTLVVQSLITNKKLLQSIHWTLVNIPNILSQTLLLASLQYFEPEQNLTNLTRGL